MPISYVAPLHLHHLITFSGFIDPKNYTPIHLVRCRRFCRIFVFTSPVPMGRSRLELMILGNMKNDPSSLMLLTVMKNFCGLGYMLQVRKMKDEYTDADIDGIREEWSTFVANFIFR
ncbi:hypothetical protein L1987_09013 [Smallanthus sonchifolius]|uniref:Uncharacterized protein n=1 Tax=Smallanthus sonchifolius TaxID=185202 RepID=A0ACB9JMA4_9ASTR|nr:hypothetical protein L1987_09013 [Smallanthus sonchifolius]